ncbi:hypothetical protein [Cloacibacillus sp. An23]|uniref:hypothetical protein n=1 Tax=Cloacibacillus sp. An23 TaxID=1965591 RepID=UPI000B3AC8B5|nr:hypothetical protein [Cloacibacillus sp. An23]OUO94763.1 hypothetical protein B5F39_02530 [Cloacibacillus sp. An23]
MKREIDVSKIPRRGYIGKREVEAIFGYTWQTLTRHMEKGLITLPAPMCRRVPEGVYGATAPLKWPAEEIWAAYRESRKGVAA